MARKSGLIEAGVELPHAALVVRDVGYAKMRKNCDDEILGPSGAAFLPRAGEHYLSVTWCGYFQGARQETQRCAAEVLRRCRNIKSLACFCYADVSAVKRIVDSTKAAGRAVYYPEADNAAHAGIHEISSVDEELCELLAEEVWAEYIPNMQIDELPESDCEPN